MRRLLSLALLFGFLCVPIPGASSVGWCLYVSGKGSPDGGMFVSDWHDTGECHNYNKTHPSGRIYKVTYGKPKQSHVNLAAASVSGGIRPGALALDHRKDSQLVADGELP